MHFRLAEPSIEHQPLLCQISHWNSGLFKKNPCTIFFSLFGCKNNVLTVFFHFFSPGSYCIRLVIFCLGFGIIILLAVLERLDHRVEYRSNEPDFSSSTELNTFSDFSGSLIGIVVFLVFGMTKDAFRTMGIVFLPCFFLRKKLSEDLESQADLDTAANTLRTSLERPRSSNRRNSGLVKDDDI